MLVRSCPALRLEVDTLRWIIRADVQGQTVARYLCERSGREEEAGASREAGTCRSASAMTTTALTSMFVMLTTGFSLVARKLMR